MTAFSEQIRSFIHIAKNVVSCMKIEQRNIKQNHNTEAGVKVDKCVNLPPPEY